MWSRRGVLISPAGPLFVSNYSPSLPQQSAGYAVCSFRSFIRKRKMAPVDVFGRSLTEALSQREYTTVFTWELLRVKALLWDGGARLHGGPSHASQPITFAATAG